MARAAILLSVILAATAAQAATIFVATNGSDAADGLSWTGAVASITQGVAKASAGDTVLVAPGTYPVAVTVNKAISLVGQLGFSRTFIDLAGNGGRCLLVSATGACVRGFSITGGVTNNAEGAGIRITGPQNAIERCDVYGNTTTNSYGGGVAIMNSRCSLIGCRVRNNLARYGSGVFIESPRYWNEMIYCIIVANTATQPNESGGLRDSGYATRIQNCIIEANSPYQFYSGGGLAVMLKNAAVGNAYGSFNYLNLGAVYFGVTSAPIAMGHFMPTATNNGVGTNAVAGDYRLRQTSAARRAGTPIPPSQQAAACGLDFYGNSASPVRPSFPRDVGTNTCHMDASSSGTYPTNGSPFGASCLYFAGTTNSGGAVRIPSGALTGSFTLEYWLLIRDYGRHMVMGDYLIDSGGSSYFVSEVNDSPDGSVRLYYNGVDFSTAGGVVPSNAWAHIAAVRDTATTNFYIYVNGNCVKTNAGVGADVSAANVYSVGVGRDGRNDATVTLWGELAEMRLWTVARSGADILAKMSNRMTGAEAGLAACWPMDETGYSRADAGASSTTPLTDASFVGGFL